MPNSDYGNQNGTLVVVDMQPDYEASCHPWTITKVKKAITSARHANWGIVIVEFADHCPTHRCLLKPLLRKTRYDKFTVVEKDIPNGSEPIIAAIQNFEFDDTLIRVCGVNTDQCVQETVSGLARRLERSKIEVITDACNCDTGNRWKSFERLDNVALLGNWWQTKQVA